MNEEEKNYGLFNGRRTADNYVKAYLKGVLAIAGITLTIAIGIGSWTLKTIIDHDRRLITIESSRFDNEKGNKLLGLINENKFSFAKIDGKLSAIYTDMHEVKTILRRTAPYERTESAR